MTRSATRSALVTGASRGIGRGIAVDLAREGYRLTVTARDGEQLARLADELRAAGAPDVAYHAADLAEPDALPALTDLHHERFATMDALVLSGGGGTAGPLDAVALRRVEKTLAVNVTASVVLIREALPLLRAAADGSPFGRGSY